MDVTGEKVVLDILSEFIPEGMEVLSRGKTVGSFQHCQRGRCLVTQGERLWENVAQFIQEKGGWKPQTSFCVIQNVLRPIITLRDHGSWY